MVTYLPGAEQLAPHIAKFGETLTKVLDPDREFRELLKLSIAQDPKVLKTLADISINSPDLFSVLGASPDVVEAIKRTGPSLNAKQEQKLGDKTVEVAGKKLELDSTQIDNILKALQSDDQVAKDAALKTLTNQTSAQRTIEQAEASVASDVAAAKGAKAKLDVKHLQKIFELPDMTPTNITNIVESLATGKEVDPALMMQIATTPGMMEAFDAARLFRLEQEREANRKIAEVDALERAKILAARQNFYRSGVGSTQAWLEYDDPATQQRVETLRKQPYANLSFEDMQLLAVADAAGAQESQRKQSRIGDVALDLGRLSQQYYGLREQPGRQGAALGIITQIQATLDNNQDIFGQRITVHPDRRGDKLDKKTGKFTPGTGDVRGTKLTYTTPDGLVVPEAMVLSGIGLPPTSTSRQSIQEQPTEQPTEVPPPAGVSQKTINDVIAAQLKLYYEQPADSRDAWLEGLKARDAFAYQEVTKLLRGNR